MKKKAKAYRTLIEWNLKNIPYPPLNNINPNAAYILVTNIFSRAD